MTLTHNSNPNRLGAEDRAFEVLISASPPPPDFRGDWVSLAGAPAGSALQLVTRHYYETVVSVAADPSAVPVSLSISLADPATGKAMRSQPAPVPTDESMARKLTAVGKFVQKHSTELEQDPAAAPKWFSFELNVFGNPAVFRQAFKH